MDGLTDRRLHRPCSRLLVRLLVRLPVSPNAVTLLGFAVGLAAARQFWEATPASGLLGLALYVASAVLDHADGDLARLTGRVSKLGRWLDVAADTAIQALVVLGMAATAARLGSERMLAAGVVAATGIILSALVANALPPRSDESSAAARLTRGLANRDAFYLALAAFVFSRWRAEWLLPLLVWILAAGTHAYWLAYLVGRHGAPSR
jgi:phosphatidylglycerophosphate synthase